MLVDLTSSSYQLLKCLGILVFFTKMNYRWICTCTLLSLPSVPLSHRAPPRPALSWWILNMPCDVVSICQHLSGTEYISYFYHSCHEMLDKCHLKKVLFWFYFGSWFEGTVHRDRGGMMAGARGSSCQASHLQSGSRERYVIAPLFPFLFI